MTPDVFDGEGKAPPNRRRRTGGRRDDDPTDEIVRGTERWAQLLVLHRGKAVVIASALVSMVTYAATALGMRYVGPKEDIVAVRHEIASARGTVDTLTMRVVRVEQLIQEGKDDRAEIKRTLEDVVYMQCMKTPLEYRPRICSKRVTP